MGRRWRWIKGSRKREGERQGQHNPQNRQQHTYKTSVIMSSSETAISILTGSIAPASRGATVTSLASGVFLHAQQLSPPSDSSSAGRDTYHHHRRGKTFCE